MAWKVAHRLQALLPLCDACALHHFIRLLALTWHCASRHCILFFFTQVRTVPVQVKRVPVDKLNVRAPKVEEVNSFEASLRVDALASAGTLGLRSVFPDC